MFSTVSLRPCIESLDACDYCLDMHKGASDTINVVQACCLNARTLMPLNNEIAVLQSSVACTCTTFCFSTEVLMPFDKKSVISQKIYMACIQVWTTLVRYPIVQGAQLHSHHHGGFRNVLLPFAISLAILSCDSPLNGTGRSLTNRQKAATTMG